VTELLISITIVTEETHGRQAVKPEGQARDCQLRESTLHCQKRLNLKLIVMWKLV
jgi:hypothetical protein